MFPRAPKFLRLLMFSCVYIYCLLLLHHLQGTTQTDTGQTKAFGREFHARAAHIQAECAAHPPPLTKLETQARLAAQVSTHLAQHYLELHLKEVLKNVLFLPHHNITWCIVPKVASSSMSRALLELDGPRPLDSSVPLQVALRRANARSVEPARVNQSISASVKFLFVRHPFQRLVSAYRNKLEDSYSNDDGEYFYKNYGWRIVQMFGRRGGLRDEEGLDNEGNQRGTGDTEPKSQSEDAKKLATNGEEEKKLATNVEGKTQDEKEKGEVVGNPVGVAAEGDHRREPTFLEYVDYLLHTDPSEYDEHWKPITLLCQVCVYSYDYIIKYENFKEESDYLVEVLQEDGKVPRDFKLGWENRKGTDGGVATTYLSQIGEDKLRKLYKKYYQDFLYFGYTMEEYTQHKGDNDV